ncbi:hypothetical protein BDD12DRAFT_809049 [Trichophaea hybrida]|nr:hypothetical protein BDD12DRAFT_809049 [Trichophaea hybrida]
MPLANTPTSSHGHAMRSEADVKVLAKSFYIDPDYDWVLPSEVVLLSHSAGVFQTEKFPDMALVKQMETPGGSSLDKPVVFIEFKAPGLHLVHNGWNSALNHYDVSQDWVRMTKQWKCRRLILMNEKMAWYFYITVVDFKDPDRLIYCVSAEVPFLALSTVSVCSSLEHQIPGTAHTTIASQPSSLIGPRNTSKGPDHQQNPDILGTAIMIVPSGIFKYPWVP